MNTATLPCRALALLFTLAWLASSSVCFASSTYPPRIKTRWGVSGKLPGGGADGCLLCHSVEKGGLNTATKPFAQTLRQKYNLTGADDDALIAALDKDKKNADDSDRDGFSDYEEIATAGTDPNDAADKPAPPTSTGGTSGTGGSSATGGEIGAAGADAVSGGASSAGGAPGAGASPDEPEPEYCTPEQKIYPTPGYGCQFGAGAPANLPLYAAAMVGWCLLARRSRSRRRF